MSIDNVFAAEPSNVDPALKASPVPAVKLLAVVDDVLEANDIEPSALFVTVTFAPARK